MRRFFALILAVPILLLVLWLALGRGNLAPAPEAAQPAPAAEVKAAPPDAVLETAPQDKPSVEATARAQRSSIAPPKTEGESTTLAELVGRIVFEGGAPAAGTKLELGGWESNTERVLKFGKPKDWKPLSAECDADGRFSLRFDPPRAYQFFLEARHAGWVKASWRWGELEPGQKKDLGDTVLVRGGAVAGCVLDAQGQSTRIAWQVEAESQAIVDDPGVETARGYTDADAATGAFRIEDLPPGRVKLSAHSDVANWIQGPTLEVRAGETTEADFRYTGPDNSRRITVITFARPFYVFDHEIDSIQLVAPGKEPRTAKKIEHSSQSFSFEDVEPGTYSLTIDDPKFKPWRQDGVQPGQSVRAKLKGASSVSLAVIDAATRAPVAHYSLRARFDNVTFWPKEFEVFGADAGPPANGLVEGLIPVEQTLIVVAEGYAACELPLGQLKAGEVRPVTAELCKGATLVACVLLSDGATPVAGAKVTLQRTAPDAGAEPKHVIFAGQEGQREVQTGPDGRARFAAVAAGSYDLRCELTPLLVAQLHAIEIAPADSEKSADLRVPPSGWLAGRLLGFEQSPVEGCSLFVVPLALSEQERGIAQARMLFSEGEAPNPVGKDGSFRVGPLLAGRSKVTLQYPKVTTHNGPGSSSSSPGAAVELGEVEIPAGAEKQQDFDLRDKLPGRIEVQVSVNGANVPGVVVWARPPQGNSFSIQLDEHGHGTSGAIPAGPVSFDVLSNEEHWSWTPPGSWTVASNQTLRVQWDVALAAGTLQLVDAANGTPLAKKSTIIRPDGEEFAMWTQLPSDEQGMLALRLVPGAYRLAIENEFGPDRKYVPSPYAEARFDWTASGAVNAALKLSKKP